MSFSGKIEAGRALIKSAAGLVRDLAGDQRGNAMLIAAAAIIPIIATIGGGLDISRAYLVKARLNQACDAAALAGRRAMSNEDIETAKPEALKYFNFNFPQGYMGTSTFAPTVTHPDTGVVSVAASTSTPTTLMKIFGYTTIPVNVTCDATQNFDNLDIMLVLDTTGSMAYNISGSSEVGDSSKSSKMYALRQAVMALYDELKSAQDQLAAEGLRLRYGIVPYSSAVNVGKLVYAQNSSYIATSWTYQSRVPVWGTDWRGRTVFDSWRYQPVTYDLTSYVSGGNLTAPVGNNGSDLSMAWAGCIEERQTTSSIKSGDSLTSIPSDAYDLNIDKIPSDAASKWKPYIASPHSSYTSVEYYRTSSSSGSTPQKACPQQASRLKSMTRDEMQDYVDSLFSDGGTYHDIGMIWGARFLSPNGIFGSDNPSIFNDRPVHRFIIFMTDGILDTGPSLYSSYGLEAIDERVTGDWTSSSDQNSRHRTRFLMACNAAKQMGASVWTIVFASGEDDTLKSCASNDDQYALSEDSDDLIAKFKEIGKNIGALRLSK